MGYYADKFAGRGTLYLLTRDEEPFCGKFLPRTPIIGYTHNTNAYDYTNSSFSPLHTANQYMVKVENSPENAAADDETKSITFGKIQITLIDDLELNETFVITQ